MGTSYSSGSCFSCLSPPETGGSHTIPAMNGLIMDYPLTLSTIVRRAEQVFRAQEIVWRNADKTLSRYSFPDFADRARRLARVLLDLGLKPGDRVATLSWNHGPHLEAYF